MQRFYISGIVRGIGYRVHITRQTCADAARSKFRRAYSKFNLTDVRASVKQPGSAARRGTQSIIYEYVSENPGCTIKTLSADLNMLIGSCRARVLAMTKSGTLRQEGRETVRDPKLIYAVDGMEPRQ